MEMTDLTCLDEITAVHVAELFRALGDASRIQIVSALIDNEINVGELAKVAGISESAASHQLRTLRQMRLVKTRRQGREVYYSLDDDHITDLIQRAIDHVVHE
jgi:ArsR family transcriptional regulator